MQKLIKHTLYLFLIIMGITALITLFGIIYIWSHEGTKLLYLEWLIGAIIIEIAAVIFIIAKKGVKYLPDVQINKTNKETLNFMTSFISTGSSATIVSNRVSWLANNDKLITILQKKIQEGIRIEIITPKAVSQKLQDNLRGATFIVTKEISPPESRFTLINGERSGSEKLAIARGAHPQHEITIFDSNSGPQIIAMAKDIIRKSKELAHAE
ncbi:MAG TPA: hypothetical protein H9889_03340 [Candidatus Ignatzschineria merdigallinarum]|uniref:Uncharacterized protein n=1 Tax=Candidatus Ignatzschineria merdigallinarum TaxID=2838621 RepID=A0A9D1Q688_9GAMM|nr:hypothetical protein [Candidatus Ignatzschineria merdigallinarum]